MEIHNAVVVLADIGGYTRFIKSHGMALMHAERIITELLESVIDQAMYPLTLNKLEGDAALFYALADSKPDAVCRSALQQANGFFRAFAVKQRTLDAHNLCQCSACTSISQLRIKAILHYGQVAFKRVRQFEELAGESIIVAHRLLKNHVQREEYVLVTQAFDRTAGGQPGRQGTPMVEDCEGIGQVQTVVYEPDRSEPLPPPPKVSRIGKLSQLARLMGYALMRKLKMLREREFPNLAGL